MRIKYEKAKIVFNLVEFDEWVKKLGIGDYYRIWGSMKDINHGEDDLNGDLIFEEEN